VSLRPSKPDGLELAVVMRALEGGGAQRDMVLLCNALVKRLAPAGGRLTLMVLRAEGPLRALLDPAIAVVQISGGKIRYAVPGLRRAILAANPTVMVSSEASLNLCSLIAVRTLPRRRRPKLVLREVGSPSIAQDRDPYRQNRIAYRILRRLYRHADRIVALTDGARRDLSKNFSVPDRQIAVMYTNAVLPPDVLERLERWDGETGREDDLIVSVGRLSPEKDHLTLLRALLLLHSDRQFKSRPWRLAIVGDGAERLALETFVRQNGLEERIIFTGHVADPFGWMMRARVAVCSSVYEGLGNAIIEALACGTTVVSTDCPYGPREILQGGRYGTLIPVGDAAAMAAALENALAHGPDRTALMRRGRDYTAARAAERFLEIVRDMHSIPTGVDGTLAAATAS
jgi:glycosyltransferase involved in cell wall biosynthesis